MGQPWKWHLGGYLAAQLFVGMILPSGVCRAQSESDVDPWRRPSDPIVTTIEAEALAAVGTVEVIADDQASGGAAAVLEGVGSGLKLSWPRMRAGVYAVWVCGKVLDADAVDDSGQTRPLYLELEIDSAIGGKSRRHRLRVPFHRQGLYEYIARIYFHAPEERTYEAELSISERSAVTRLALDRIELRNPLGDLAFQPLKSARNLYDAERVRLLRVAAASAGTLPEAIRPQPLPPERRRVLDDLLWHESIVPLNATGATAASRIDAATEAFARIAERQSRLLDRPLGSWLMPPMAYDRPWVMRHEGLGLEYTLADYRAGRALPAPWPFPEDSGGYYFDKALWPTAASFTYGQVPRAIERREAAILAALGAAEEPEVAPAQCDLPQKYLLLGDLEAAADAAFLLAAYAYRYPGYDWHLHGIDNICDVSATFEPEPYGRTHGRGCAAAPLATRRVIALLHAYDKLFPYIQGNEALARRIGRFIPWVITPDDVVKLLDTFLVQRAARDARQEVLEAPVLLAAADVLGGDAGQRYRLLYRRLTGDHDSAAAPSPATQPPGLARVTQDQHGLVTLDLHGVRQVSRGRISATVGQSWFYWLIQAVDDETRTITLDAAPGDDRFAGRIFSLDSPAGDQWASEATQVRGRVLTMERSSQVGHATVDPVTGGGQFIRVSDLWPTPGGGADSFHDVVVRDEAQRVLGRGSIVADQWRLFTGWPEARRHLTKIGPADLTDADGDGRVTVTMIAARPVRKPTAAGAAPLVIDAGAKMLQLEVTGVREDGYGVFVATPADAFLNGQGQADPFEPYRGQIIRNEAGTRQWRIGLAGEALRLVMSQGEVAAADLPDADQDGRRRVSLHACAPGDVLQTPASIHLERLEQDSQSSARPLQFELLANTACTLTFPGAGAGAGSAAFISHDNGQTWRQLPAESIDGTLRIEIAEQHVGSGHALLKLQP